jgi:plasmid maintenance system antidote protein VapI
MSHSISQPDQHFVETIRDLIKKREQYSQELAQSLERYFSTSPQGYPILRHKPANVERQEEELRAHIKQLTAEIDSLIPNPIYKFLPNELHDH